MPTMLGHGEEGQLVAKDRQRTGRGRGLILTQFPWTIYGRCRDGWIDSEKRVLKMSWSAPTFIYISVRILFPTLGKLH